MEDDSGIPVLITLIFGEHGRVVHADASKRLLRWCRAFDDWLAYRGRKYSQYAYKKSLAAWREFLALVLKTPWEVEGQDVEDYIDSQNSRGLQKITIINKLNELSGFYEWNQKRGSDPQCEPGFNPVKSVPWPRYEKYSKAYALSFQEATALLETIQKEGSILSQRDYAFTLTRLLMGNPVEDILKMQWRQIHHKKDGTWLKRDTVRRKWFRIPETAWDAIRAYLEASGRWDQMKPQNYIFAPLADPMRKGATGKAEDWDAGRHLQPTTIRNHLLRFAKKVGIPDHRLKMSSLRNTAAMLRQEAGDDLEQITEFLGLSHSKGTLYYLDKIYGNMNEEMKEVTPEVEQNKVEEKASYSGELSRQPNRMKPGHGRKHGLLSNPPQEEVEAILKENIQGLEDEIQGLEWLNEELFNIGKKLSDWDLRLDIASTYTRTLARLHEINQINEQLLEEARDGMAWGIYDYVHAFDEPDDENPPVDFDTYWKEVYIELYPSGEMADYINTSDLDQKIARVRVLLRGALESAPALIEPRDYLRMVERYGKTAMTLAKSLAKKKKLRETGIEALAVEFDIKCLAEMHAELKAKYGRDN